MRHASLIETLETLGRAREQHDAALVAFSGGKDSCACLDLALSVFPKVEAYMMVVMPGLRYAEEALGLAERHWGVKTHQFPDYAVAAWLTSGVYCDPVDNVPRLKPSHALAFARSETGIELIIHGAKRADSFMRRAGTAHDKRHDPDLCYPLLGWSKADVLLYLGRKNIEPIAHGTGNTTSVSLTRRGVQLWAKRYPEDIDELRRVFRYLDAALWHERWYGAQAEA